MRLIDADELIKEMSKWYWDKEKQKAAENDVSPMDLFTNLAITTVKGQPTAFDMDNVVEQLKNLKKKDVCEDCSCVLCKYNAECHPGAYADQKVIIDKAIEIVKGGGTNTTD